MCVPLCDSVTESGESSRLLAEIERANLFLVPLDDRGEWFRYHHLFAELLRDALRRRGGNAERMLHRRACAWFESAGDVEEAIHHAITSGDLDTAATLVTTHWLSQVNSGRLATLVDWLDAFPRQVLRADSRLCITEAWTHSLAGDAVAAQGSLADARRAGYEGELPDGSGTVEESATLARATWPWGDVGAMLTAARSAHLTERRRASLWQPLAALNLGWALVLAGETGEAISPLRHAAALAERHEQWIVAADSHCLLAKASLITGELDEAERWIDEALELAHAHGIADLPHVGYYHAIVGALLARRGASGPAERAIGRGLEQMRDHADPLLVADALLELAIVRRARGARTEARATLAEARAAIEHCPDAGTLTDRAADVARKLSTAQGRAAPGSVLTERELEVLRLLAEGLTKREVARLLFVSYSTVHSHTKSIYRKLDGTSRDEVLERARDEGLITTG
jgi:LuxR family maltose regulon positive regulatory protein